MKTCNSVEPGYPVVPAYVPVTGALYAVSGSIASAYIHDIPVYDFRDDQDSEVNKKLPKNRQRVRCSTTVFNASMIG